MCPCLALALGPSGCQRCGPACLWSGNAFLWPRYPEVSGYSVLVA